jgi:predicted  nucleic acid-binding Zn-ribbon protein
MDLPETIAPIPGDPSVIRWRASQYAQTADAILEAVSGLRTAIAETRNHRSDALDVLAENAGTVAHKLATLENRYRVASESLTDFAGDLESAQQQASPLVAENQDASAQLTYANSRIRQYEQQRLTTTDPNEMVELNQELIRLHSRANTQRSTLNSAQARFTSIVETLRQSGRDAASRLRTATDGDGLNDSILDNINGWVQEHAEILKAIRQVLQVITTALSVLSFVFPVLAPFALAAGLLTAGLGLLLAAAGEISWVDFGLDVLAVATLGVGAIASKGVGQVVNLMRANRLAVVTNALPQATSRGFSAASRLVTNSFDNVLGGALTTVKTPLPGLTLGERSPEFLRRAMELITAKGGNNADFLRLLQNPTVTGSNATIDSLIALGQTHRFTAQLAGGVNMVLHQADSTLGDRIPSLLNALPDTFTDNVVGDALRGASDWYNQDVQDASTWRVGS